MYAIESETRVKYCHVITWRIQIC